jgi:hypothetical protein
MSRAPVAWSSREAIASFSMARSGSPSFQQWSQGPRNGGPSSKMWLERRDDLVERVQVLAVLIDELRGGLRLRHADSPALLEPPGGGVEVEPADVELVDGQRPSRRDQLAEPTAGILERVDVVEGDDRDRGRERLGGLATSTRATA